MLVEMKKRYILFNVAAYVSISLSIVVVAYFVNVLLLFSNEMISPTEALFFEGIGFLLFGFLLLLGRGGINRWSQSAVILSAAAEAVYGDDTVGPDEIMRRDVWKSKGFIRTGLVLVLTGVFMFLVYFLTL